jgi:hypothetical protein
MRGRNWKAQFLETLQYTQDAATLYAYEMQMAAEPSPATNERHGITGNQIRLASIVLLSPEVEKSGRGFKLRHMTHRQSIHP